MKSFRILSHGHMLLLLLISLILAGLALWTTPPQSIHAETLNTPLSQEDTTTNAECLACHAQPSPPFELPSGELLFIQVDVEAFGNSVHGRNEVICVTCHATKSSFPHPDLTAQNLHQYRAEFVSRCNECHEEQVLQAQDSIHGQLIEQGDEYAPTCADCHDPHTQPLVDEVNKAEFAKICASCHNGIYQEYEKSVHGSALTEDNNQDVPGCIDCHGVHTMADPRTAEFRNSSIFMCAECHTNPDIMDKYGISTKVLSSYVADFHGTTVTIFDETEPGQITNKAVCYDCHGVHNIKNVNDPVNGISIKENMLKACQKCHPDATINFPTSWLSHYSPDKEDFPLVYYVTLLYNILIPTVLGGMAIFVLSDIYMRIRKKTKKSTDTGVTPKSEDEEVSK